MEKTAVVMTVFMVLAAITGMLAVVAINATPVHADGNCGGISQPPCSEYCLTHPTDPICKPPVE